MNGRTIKQIRWNSKKQEGFTIIEVVLVLAVAGLIFLVVFSAIPRLQASRRDNQIKRDMEALSVLFIEYYSNTGNNPTWGPVGTANTVADAFDATPGGTFWDQYASSLDLQCPSGGGYTLVVSANPGSCQFYYVHTNNICNATNTQWTTMGANSQSWFLLYGLERGEGCLDNA